MYKIRTDAMDYEIEGKRKDVLPIGEDVEYRIEKDKVFVRRGDKEERFLLVGQEKRETK